MAPHGYNFVSIDEAAEILKVHRNTIYRAIREGTIPHIKIGSQFRIPCSYFSVGKSDTEDSTPTPIKDNIEELTKDEKTILDGTDDDYLKLAL